MALLKLRTLATGDFNEPLVQRRMGVEVQFGAHAIGRRIYNDLERIDDTESHCKSPKGMSFVGDGCRGGSHHSRTSRTFQ
jgi:hypothetical protein